MLRAIYRNTCFPVLALRWMTGGRRRRRRLGVLALGALVYTARPAPLEDRDSGDCSRLRSFVVIQEGQSITEVSRRETRNPRGAESH